MEKLTILDAYRAMFLFLTSLWERDKVSFDPGLPVLLGAMQPLDDGAPMDQAFRNDWLEATRKGVAETLTTREAFDAMLRFLEAHRWEEKNEISKLIESLTAASSTTWEEWTMHVHDVINNK
jgi:hypothetical protein